MNTSWIHALFEHAYAALTSDTSFFILVVLVFLVDGFRVVAARLK